MEIFNSTLQESYVNSQGFFYLHIDPSTRVFDPATANRIQCGFPNGASQISNITANSSLKMSLNGTLLAEWSVQLKPDQNQNTYPLGFVPLANVSLPNGNVTVTAGGNYTFTLTVPDNGNGSGNGNGSNGSGNGSNGSGNGSGNGTGNQTTTDGTLLAFGDSLTDQFPQSKLDTISVFTEVELGVSGDTVAGVLSQIQGGQLNPYNPNWIMLMIGTNDVPGHNGTYIGNGVAAIVNEIRRNRKQLAKILLVGITPRYDFSFSGNDCNDKIVEANAIIAGLADNTNVYYIYFGDDSRFGQNGEALQSDQLHYTSTAYDIWTTAVVNFFAGGSPANQTLRITVKSGNTTLLVSNLTVGQNSTISIFAENVPS